MTQVSVVKIQNAVLSDESIKSTTKKAITLIGGLESIIKEGDSVILKPNFVAPRNSMTGATTDLRIIEEVVNEVKSCGGHPIIAESSGMEFDTESTFRILKVDRLAKRLGVRLINLEKEKDIEVEIPNGIILKKLRIPKILLNTDILINLPKLKTHVFTGVSLGMKNLMGILPKNERLKFHAYGLHRSIIDLNSIIKPNLTIIDGIAAMEGDGPAFGDTVRSKLIIAGRNSINVDSVCCQFIGIDPLHVDHLSLAHNSGLRTSQVKVVYEEGVDNLSLKRFNLSKKSPFYHGLYRTIFYFDMTLSKISKNKRILPLLIRRIGTRPIIEKKFCNLCEECVNACELNAINLKRFKIDQKKCVRCLCCFDTCPQHAIKIKGFTKPSGLM